MLTETAYSLSDAYIRSADKTLDSHGVYALYEKMLVDFATRVKRAKNTNKSFSLPVMRCMEYIESNTHDRITLKDLGRAAKRNPSYLCVQFKDETGVALSAYINRQKVEEAKRLLLDSKMTVLEISAILAFCSQSYFATVFKRITGETPNDYRLSHFSNHDHKCN
jgi:YesN/AraC family two-component response regulator